MLAAVFFFFLSFLIPGFFWKSNTQAYPYTGIIKPQAGRLIGINEQVQAYIPTCRLNSNIQADSHTGSKTTSLLPHRHRGKLQAFRHTGVTQNYKLAATQATKLQADAATQATKLQAHSHTGRKLHACHHIGVTQNYKPAATQATKLQAWPAATQAQNKTTSLQPHRRHTRLQACRHTIEINKTTSFPPHRQHN